MIIKCEGLVVDGNNIPCHRTNVYHEVAQYEVAGQLYASTVILCSKHHDALAKDQPNWFFRQHDYVPYLNY